MRRVFISHPFTADPEGNTMKRHVPMQESIIQFLENGCKKARSQKVVKQTQEPSERAAFGAEVILCVDRSDLATIPAAGNSLKKGIVTSMSDNDSKIMTAGAGRQQSAGTDTGGENTGNGF